jgi:mannitol/fructose-specific phosphotransferase system IIA component (Ntr-type)
MLNYISKDNIIINKSYISWQESINLVAEPLLKNQSINQTYVDAIFKSIDKLGFYIVISKDIALPHARPEDGVIKKGISILKSQYPINFADHQIYLVIMFAATDKESHMKMIEKLINVIGNQELLNKIIKSNDHNEILEIFTKGA